jgi:hypothetical protein
MAMETDYNRLFEHLEQKEPRAGLLDKVLLSISKETVSRALWAKTVVSGIISLAAIVAIIPSWLITRSEIYQSGFSQFLSLLMSDTNTVMAFWKEFSLSLLESFPLVGTIAVFGSILIFMISIRFFVRDITRIVHQPKLIKA